MNVQKLNDAQILKSGQPANADMTSQQVANGIHYDVQQVANI